MSMFNINNIIVNENLFITNNTNSIDNIPLYTSPENFSFMNETYTFLKNYYKDYYDMNKFFYRNILECNGSHEIINESFGNFFDKISDIIKKFIEFIKKLFKKFSIKMHQLFKAEKYLEKNKKEFDKFTTDDEFVYKGYEFTYLDSYDIPESKAVDAFNAETLKDSVIDFVNDFKYTDNGIESNLEDEYTDDEDANKLHNTSNKPKSLAIANNIQQKYDNLMDNLDDFYDRFRRDLIKVDYDIDTSEWENELFKKFRNNRDDTDDIRIDSTEVRKAYYRFSHYDSNIKAVEKIRDEIEKNYKKLEEGFDKTVKIIKTNNKINLNISSTNSYVAKNLQNFSVVGNQENIISTPEINDKIKIYMKAKVAQVHEMSSIHSLAFAAKITAIKDCFIQDKQILYKALVKIQNHSNKK